MPLLPYSTLNTAGGSSTVALDGDTERDRQAAAEAISDPEPLTQGYKPTLPLWALWMLDSIPQFFLLRDIELMLIHPVVLSSLNYYKSGITGADFDVTCEVQEAGGFIYDHCQRYWSDGVPLLQGGYEYGWIAGENMFTYRTGPLSWDGLVQFSPRDVYLLSANNRPVGVRVKNIIDAAVPDRDKQSEFQTGAVDLWLATDDIPAKGLWYAHNPRYSHFYGQSQILGAWRPWRRLAWKDAAETITDLAVYRHGISGPQVSYPEEDYQASPGTPATSLDSQGRPRRPARDMARMIGEQAKSGAAVGFPSTHYPPEMGGGPKWSVTMPTSTLNVDPLISYADHLSNQIRYGVGVPPELMEAAATGSGYSGRQIPIDAFLMLQQRIADALLQLFIDQVLRPLVRWNFGNVKWSARVKPLIQTKRQLQTDPEEGAAEDQGTAGGGAAAAQQDPNQGSAGGVTDAQGVKWRPFQSEDGRPGWISEQGLVRYGPTPPGGTEDALLSHGHVPSVADRVRMIALKIIRQLQKAA